MTVVIPEVKNSDTGAESVGLCELGNTNTPRSTMLVKATRYRDYSLEELRSMPAEELRRILLDTPCMVRNSSGLSVTYGNFPSFDGIQPAMRQYVVDHADFVTTEAFARHIHESLLASDSDSAPTKKKVLNMPYPVLATYEYSGGAYGVLFKVPEHVAIFNSDSLHVHDHQYYCPSLLFYAHLNAALDITWSGVSMYTLDSPDPKLATIAHLPFPNIYSESGRICVGNMRFSSDNVSECRTVGEACMRLVSLVLGSGWRTDLTPSLFPTGLDTLWHSMFDGVEGTRLCTSPDRIYCSYDKTVYAVLDILHTAEGRDRFCGLKFPTLKRVADVLSSDNPRNGALV